MSTVVLFAALLMQGQSQSPALAEWDDRAAPSIRVKLSENNKKTGDADINLDLTVSVNEGAVRITPFVDVTRGVSLTFSPKSGSSNIHRYVGPTSPPPPPVPSSKMVEVKPGKPMVIKLREPAANYGLIDGGYKVVAKLSLFDIRGRHSRYYNVSSQPIDIDVRKGGLQ